MSDLKEVVCPFIIDGACSYGAPVIRDREVGGELFLCPVAAVLAKMGWGGFRRSDLPLEEAKLAEVRKCPVTGEEL